MRIEREKFNIMSREIAKDTTKGFKALRTRTARSYTATNAPFLERMQQDSELRHAIKRQNLTKKLYAMDSKPTPALMAPSTMHNIRDAESRRMHWTANHNVSPYDSARSQFTDMSGRVSPIETG